MSDFTVQAKYQMVYCKMNNSSLVTQSDLAFIGVCVCALVLLANTMHAFCVRARGHEE